MSATPIPRTLAMFLYAGLDISVLDELPSGRIPISTLLIPPSKKERMYSFIENEINKYYISEIETEKIGEMVMDKLKDVDEVAYVRFASVYRQFKDINTFVTELKNILMERED